jgi:oligopeptidase A
LNKFIKLNKQLPEFGLIASSPIKKNVEAILKSNRETINQLIAQDEITWDNFVTPLSLLEDTLSKKWSPVRHLNSVKSSETLRETYNNCLPLLSDYATEMSQNKALYKGFLKIAESDNFDQLNIAQKKTIKDTLKHFKLGGVDLEGKNRERYQKLQTELSELQSIYENNLLDATQSWEQLIDDEQTLAGLPDYAKKMLEQLAQQKELSGYRVTLDMPCYISVISYADNRVLRQQIYEAFTSRASDVGITDKKFDNAQIMENILVKRQEKSMLLGFPNYADYSLETKMAGSTQQVIEFLNDLAQRSKPAAIAEVKERQEFAQSLGFDGDLKPWDFTYYGEKLKQHRYQISEQDLKPYFPDQGVISGLFEIVNKLYNISIEQIEEGIDLWHPSVRFYQIKDSENNVIGQFYLDLYARENKRGGAWMDECINRYKIAGQTQIPVAYLTCNLTPPIGNEPALFTHDEVITLFHEFGHGLHHLLTKIDVPAVAGINGVEWDAVELPSQFMENYCWQKDALRLFAKHYQTGEALPDDLFDKMTSAKNFQTALQMLRQIEFSLFDIKLHQSQNLKYASEIQSILDQVRNEVSVVDTSSNNKFQNGFSHIFAGGYAAGYYSYKWAEVLSADAFDAFEEEGIFNKETGQRFLSCILEKGGSRPAIESFCCFRGREPNIDALLRHSGITS